MSEILTVESICYGQHLSCWAICDEAGWQISQLSLRQLIDELIEQKTASFQKEIAVLDRHSFKYSEGEQ